jgi:hypothetical protein
MTDIDHEPARDPQDPSACSSLAARGVSMVAVRAGRHPHDDRQTATTQRCGRTAASSRRRTHSPWATTAALINGGWRSPRRDPDGSVAGSLDDSPAPGWVVDQYGIA